VWLLTRLSLANRSLVALVVLATMAFGAYTIPQLRQQLLPQLALPTALIAAPYPGAAPAVVEQRVAAPIEAAIKGVGGAATVTSTSTEGLARVQVEYPFGTDIDKAVAELESAVAGISAQLPDSVKPSVSAFDTDRLPAIELSVSSTADFDGLAQRVTASVLPRLQEIGGVREVSVTGLGDRQLVIVPDPVALARSGVDITAIDRALRASGTFLPAGNVTRDSRTLPVQVGAPATSVAQLRDITVASQKGAVRLGDIATVEARPTPRTTLLRTNGVRSLGVSVSVDPDHNPVDISHKVRDMLDELTAASGGDVTVVYDQAPTVEKSIHSLTTEGLLGLVMAVIVILVFLMSLRSTLVTAFSIPVSVVIALIALWAGNYSLNILTLGGLTIAVGRVVDDAIVVIENVKRHLGHGSDRRTAILNAVREVAGAVTASTLTTVAVFAPIAFVGGLVGELFTSFAIAVSVALLASLLVSLTIIPVLAFWFLRPSRKQPARAATEEDERPGFIQRLYIPVVRFAARRRLVTITAGMLVLLGTASLAGGLRTSFLEQDGEDSLAFTQELPAGTSFAALEGAVGRVEAALRQRTTIESYQVAAGGETGVAGTSQRNTAVYSVRLKKDVDAKVAEKELKTVLAGLTNAGTFTTGRAGTAGGDLAVVVKAADDQSLAAATDQVRHAMSDTPRVTDVTTTLAESAPRIDVVLNRERLARFGLTEDAVGRAVAGAVGGVQLGRVSLGGVPHGVMVRLGANSPASIEQVRALPVATPYGMVRLDAVAEVVERAAPARLTRIDGVRSATVAGSAGGGDIGAVTADLTRRLDRLTLPAGASFEIGGVSADQADSFKDLAVATLAAVVLVFVVMVATFRSLAQPLVLLVSVPFASTGAIAALLLTDTSLGVPAMIGLLMLVGIVVTNAIVLMDLINQYRERGMELLPAVVEGSQRRLRPIIMTATATIFALVPMAVGLTGEGGFIAQPLAIVVIGGLISSTVLTLLLVPALYALVEGRRERRLRRRERRQLAKRRRREQPKALPGGAAHAYDMVDDGPPNGYLPRHATQENPVVPTDEVTWSRLSREPRVTEAAAQGSGMRPRR
jgi:hydrophobic/amphiphilic exporter-1 (mainly G- bacteria), HAE1 family